MITEIARDEFFVYSLINQIVREWPDDYIEEVYENFKDMKEIRRCQEEMKLKSRQLKKINKM